MRRLILRSFQSPGDVVMLTAAVRDLHAACPGQFVTDVRTSADALWLHNPHITRLEERESGVQVLEMHYPLIHHSNQRPYHFIHGYAQFRVLSASLRKPRITQSGWLSWGWCRAWRRTFGRGALSEPMTATCRWPAGRPGSCGTLSVAAGGIGAPPAMAIRAMRGR